MFFKTAYAAAKLGLKEGDQVTRKAYSEQDRAGYTPTEGLEKELPPAEMEERDWIVVPAKQTAKDRSRIHRNIKAVLGRDITQGDRANDLIAEIEKWHAETFPHATVEGQMEKLKEEELEYQESGKISEIADVIVVACGLNIHHSVVGYCILKHFRDCCYNHRPFFGKNSVEVICALEKKFAVNKERSAKGMWKEVADGVYHH